MACRGALYAITEDWAQRIEESEEGEELLEILTALDDHWAKMLKEGWIQETDKAWDAMHRCLTDGRLEYWPAEWSPCHNCILGLENYYEGNDWLVNLLRPEEVQAVAYAIRDINEIDMRKRFWAIDPRDCGLQVDEDDFEYTWGWFTGVQEFYQRAAEHGRWVVFSVDQ